MNLELGRSVGSTEVPPFTGPGEQIWDASSTCSSSLTGPHTLGPKIYVFWVQNTDETVTRL